MNRRELILGAAALSACDAPGATGPASPFPMRRGVNLGNALEAPNEGDWGYRIAAEHFVRIAEIGFDGVRLPVRWDAHAAQTAPYTIASPFLERIDDVVGQALGAGLKVQLDLHHFDALNTAPAQNQARFLAIWEQIARHFARAPAELFYEPFNEPNGSHWRGSSLPALQARVIEVIRASDQRRLIVLGPGQWQNISALHEWTPPPGANIAVSVHYYEPHAFTHQNAEWLGEAAPRFGRDWGNGDDRRAVRDHIAQAARWGAQHGYAMQLGEFGANRAAPVQQRASWTRTVREACEANGMAWCVWDFAGAFPVWDGDGVIPLMRDALFA